MTMPRTRPAMAMPRPLSSCGRCLIWLSAMGPKITARIDVTPQDRKPTKPSTSEATASPLTRRAGTAWPP